MTKIEISQNSGVLCFSVKGHAGFSSKGKDIVCAGISALAKALLERIKELEAENSTKIKQCSLADGELLLRFTLTEKSQESAKTVITGLKFISQAYPENCQLNNSICNL